MADMEFLAKVTRIQAVWLNDVNTVIYDVCADQQKQIPTTKEALRANLGVALSVDVVAQSHVGSGGSQHASATGSLAGFMSAADKSKLDSIAPNLWWVYNKFTDGTTIAEAASVADTFKFRSANANISVAVGSNDLTHGDNLLISMSATPSFTTVSTTGDVTVGGNLYVQGTTVSIASTTIQVADKNIELAKIGVPTDITADGGGITIWGTTNKTITWYNSTQDFTSSENFNLIAGKTYRIGGMDVLSSQILGTSVIYSSLTTVGTLTQGTWNASTISTSAGGTGIITYTLGDLLYSSAANTLSKLAGNVTTTKQFLSQTGAGGASSAPIWSVVTKSDVGLSVVENTAVSTWAGTSNITTLGTITTGVWNASTIDTTKGGTGLTSIGTAGQVLSVNSAGTALEYSSLFATLDDALVYAIIFG